MEFTLGIHCTLLIALAFCTSSCFGTLYLAPQTKEHGFFTDDSFFVTCFTTDANLDKVSWTDNDGKTITETQGRVHIQISDGQERGLRLVFQSFEKEDAGSYTCSDESSSLGVEITVYRSVSFGDTPSEQHAAEGDTATIICNVKADPKPIVSWYFKSKNKTIHNNQKYKMLENHSLRIQDLERNDTGEYICKAYVITSHNTQVKDFHINLHVQYKPEIIGDSRLAVYATLGVTKRLFCNITSEPKPMFQWLHDEMIIHNETDNFLVFNNENSSILQMPIDEERWGEYTCRGSNPLGVKEVIVELKEGATPLAPELSVAGEDQGVVKLSLRVSEEDRKKSDDLKVNGFRVEYVLASETWDNSASQDFIVGEAYELRNMSFNSDYLLRASAHNAAGYGNFSEELTYRTHSLETASVISGSPSIYATVFIVLGCLATFMFH